MELKNTFWISVYIVIGMFLLYKIMFRKNTYREDYEKAYKEILTSGKYKVKGQYDKEE